MVDEPRSKKSSIVGLLPESFELALLASAL
jgi:hypothetical protein